MKWYGWAITNLLIGFVGLMISKQYGHQDPPIRDCSIDNHILVPVRWDEFQHLMAPEGCEPVAAQCLAEHSDAGCWMVVKCGAE